MILSTTEFIPEREIEKILGIARGSTVRSRNVARDLGCIASVCNLSYPSNFLILPIPSESVNLNQNIQQNAGY